MLILTKEEVNEKINCFRKLIGIYNTKIDFLQKLLVYFEKNGQTVDCIVLNICVKGVAEEIFSCDDQIQILPQQIDLNENISPSTLSTHYTDSVDNCNSKPNDFSESISISPIKCNEIPFSTNVSLSNIDPGHALPFQEQPRSKISHKDYSPNSLHSSLHIAFPNDTQRPLMMNLKSEPTVTNLINNINCSNFQHSISSNLVKPNAVNSDSKRLGIAKFKKPQTNSECRDQLNSKNVFLSNTSLDDLNQIHSTIKTEETISNSKNGNSKSTALKQFKCEFCSSAFAQKGVLNRHKFLRHSPTVIKPHICPKCQKGFTLKHHLKNHLKCKSGCRYFS